MASMSTEDTKDVRIRRVPAEVHRALKVAAAMRGIDLNDVLLEALAEAAKREGKAKK